MAFVSEKSVYQAAFADDIKQSLLLASTFRHPYASFILDGCIWEAALVYSPSGAIYVGAWFDRRN